jgi:indole-3-glycerol phosphate synthase
VKDSSFDAILTATRHRVAGLRGQARDLERRAAAAPEPPRFDAALSGHTVGVIAEVKRRSPSAGTIRADLDPVAHARSYARAGAAAISVLTDEDHFGGSLDDLARVASVVNVPVLRKDFILDELQLYEARAAGASGVLLIVRALDRDGLRTLARAALGLGLGILVETHSEPELEIALGVAPTAVGVNSRDLATFAVDLERAERLLTKVPPGVAAVAESGIETRADVRRLAAAGADLVLVGTSLSRASDPEEAVRGLTGVARQGRAG